MLGVDVSKATLACAFVEPTTRQCVWEVTVPNSAAGVAQVLRRTPAGSAVVVEPTGRYSDLVVQAGRAAGRAVLLAQPKRARAFLASLSPRAKTDRVDSRGLAMYGVSVPLAPFPDKSEAMIEVEQLLQARKGISERMARLRQQQQALPYAAGPLAAAIAALADQQAELDRQIASATRTTTAVARLDAIPGVGPVTAAAVATCLGGKQFDHPDQFVAYVGLDVRVRESGQRRGQGALSKQGDAELRRLLYLCAQANLRVRDPENPFKAQYARERAKGMSSTAATCAVTRKLARTCWSLVRHEADYDAKRVGQQPENPSLVSPLLDGEP